MSRTECPVCLESVPEGKVVVCEACETVACRECTKAYILGTDKLAHCMGVGCRVEWTTSFLVHNFTKAWVNSTKPGGYRHHRKNIALERERARLPETLMELPAIKKDEEIDERIKELKKNAKELRKQLSAINRQIGELEEEKSQKKKKKEFRFLCPCPREDCPGMIRSDSFACVSCDGKVCRRCREPREEDDDHECNEDVIANLELVRDETKPCPKCAVAIYKIDGCDQMWCTECHTAFSWRSGAIDNGPIHNPHAIRWRREHGEERNIRDVPCGGLIDFDLIEEHIFNKGRRNRLYNVYRVVAEVDNVINGMYRVNDDFSYIRKAYALGKKTEKQWKQAIFVRERRNERNHAASQIMRTLRDLGAERFRDLYETLEEYEHSGCLDLEIDEEGKEWLKRVVAKFMKEMQEIFRFTNTALNDELTLLGSKKPPRIMKYNYAGNVKKQRFVWSFYAGPAIFENEIPF